MKSRIVIVLTLVLATILLALNLQTYDQQHYFFLARALLQGKTYFVDWWGEWWDTVYLAGRYYWPLGVLPAVIMMPGVWIFGQFGLPFFQGFLQPVVGVGVFYMCMKVAKAYKYTWLDQWWWGLAMCGASCLLFVLGWSWSWYFSQAIAMCGLMMAIVEYVGKRRYYLIGTVMGLVALTRLTAGVGIVFFVLDILTRLDRKWSDMGKLLVPFMVLVLVYTGYNQLRFGRWYDQGYSGQIQELEIHKRDREKGVFSVIHIPGNLYYMLLSVPVPVYEPGTRVLVWPFIQLDPWGASIFLTSPWLVYVLWKPCKDRMARNIVITVAVVAIPIVTYFGIGAVQLGYRYSLDFMPWIYLLLVRRLRNPNGLPSGFKRLVLLATGTNTYMFLTRIGKVI